MSIEMIRLRKTLWPGQYGIASSGLALHRTEGGSWQLVRSSETEEAQQWELRNAEAFEHHFSTLHEARTYIEACSQLDPLPDLSGSPVPRSALRPQPQGGYVFRDPEGYFTARITRGATGWTVMFSRRTVLVPTLYAARCVLGAQG